MIKTIFNFIVGFMVLSAFCMSHFLLFNYYQERLAESDACHANLVVLQAKYDNALIKESSVKEYITDNLWPSLKETGSQIVSYVKP